MTDPGVDHEARRKLFAAVGRVLLTAGFAGGLILLSEEKGTAPELGAIAVGAGFVVGFLVGRWWVIFAMVGATYGRMLGWDPGEHDGNPALWLPYIIGDIVFFGLPLLAGFALAWSWRAVARTSREARDRGA